MPSLATAALIALAGWDCRVESGPATTPCAPISASQLSPSSSALALLITTTAAAPSEIGEAEPAVMVPSLRKAGRSLASDSTRGVGADALVDAGTRSGRPCAAGSSTGDHLVVEQAVLPALGGQLVAARGEGVLLARG